MCFCNSRLCEFIFLFCCFIVKLFINGFAFLPGFDIRRVAAWNAEFLYSFLI